MIAEENILKISFLVEVLPKEKLKCLKDFLPFVITL